MLFFAGPRQVGKTTISLTAKEMSKNFRYFNWDVQDDRQLIIEGSNAVAMVAGLQELQTEKSIITFDEIHKYGKWKTFLKGFYDSYKDKCHIIVTGSSKLDVYRKGGDSLMGRYFPYRVHPLSVAECIRTTISENEISQPKKIDDDAFDALWTYGGFPDPFLQRNNRFFNKWKQLRHQQLFREDIRDLSQIQEVEQLELLALLLKNQSGQLLNYSTLSKQTGVAVTTIKRWINTLESFYFCFTITPWSKNITRSLLKEPKVFLWDWSDITDEGARFETFVASHLIKAVHFWNDMGLGEYGLHFIRDKEKREVDFLVVKNGAPWILIEAKKSNNQSISEHLFRFKEQTQAPYAFQVVLSKDFIETDCFQHQEPIIVPARTLLSQLV